MIRRALIGTAVLLSALVIAALMAVGWIYSDRILTPTPYGLMPEFQVVEVHEGADGALLVTLPLPSEADPPQFARTAVRGTYGLLWEGGHGHLGPVLERSGSQVVRPLQLVGGEPPSAGADARIDITLYRPDPGAIPFPFQEVRIDTELGPAPAWWLPQDPEHAWLVVHGRRRADRTEGLRWLPTLMSSGESVLVATYRNHDGAPDAPDGLYRYGAAEARDLRAALGWLAREGVQEVRIVALSMGASVAVQALLSGSEDGPQVTALLMEAPLVDPESVFRVGAEDMGLPAPGLFTWWATKVAGWRTGVDFAALDLRRQAASLNLPVLLIGDLDDSTVPIELVDAFAERLPDVTYLRIAGAEHMEAWNVAPDQVEEAVQAFIRRTAADR